MEAVYRSEAVSHLIRGNTTAAWEALKQQAFSWDGATSVLRSTLQNNSTVARSAHAFVEAEADFEDQEKLGEAAMQFFYASKEEEDARKTRHKREADRGPAGHECDQDDQEQDTWGLGPLTSLAWEAIEVEFHLREAELKLQARGRSRTRRSTTMGGLLSPNWTKEEVPEEEDTIDEFNDYDEDEDEEAEEEEEEEEVTTRKKKKSVKEGSEQYVGAMAFFFPIAEWILPWNGEVHFLPTGQWYSFK